MITTISCFLIRQAVINTCKIYLDRPGLLTDETPGGNQRMLVSKKNPAAIKQQEFFMAIQKT